MSRFKHTISILMALIIVGALSITGTAAKSSTSPSIRFNVNEVPTIDELQTCFSQRNANLDVMILLDVSKSFKENDKKNKRKEMLLQTIDLFSNIAEAQETKSENKKVNISITTFANEEETKVSMGWTDLRDKKSVVNQQITSLTENENLRGTKTLWADGLRIAVKELNERQRSFESCPVLIWVTDGQIDTTKLKSNDPNNKVQPADITQFEQICESKPLIDQIPVGTTLLGALLSAEFSNPPTDSQIANTNSKQQSIFLFRSVIEGTASDLPQKVATDFTNGQRDYECGNPSRSGRGKLIQEKDPEDLAWEFVDLVASITNLVKLDSNEKDDISIEVDDALAKIVFYVKREGREVVRPAIFDPSGNSICGADGKANCEDKSSKNKLMATFQVDIPPNNSGSGTWRIRVDGESKFFGSIFGDREGDRNIFLALTAREYDEGQSTIQLTLESEQEIDWSQVFKETTAAISINNDEVDSSSIDINGNTITFDYFLNSDNDEIKAVVRLTSRLTGDEYSVPGQFAIEVTAKGLLPTVNCGDGCKLNDIPNARQSSSTDIRVKGAERSSSKVRFTGNTLIDAEDEDTARRDSYVLSITPRELQLDKNEEQVVQLQISNEIPGTGCVSGLVEYEVSTPNTNGWTTKYFEVTACTGNQINWLVIVLFYILFLIIGIGVPYLLLLRSAKKYAVINDASYRMFKVQVKINDTGKLLTFTQVDSGDDPLQPSSTGESTWREFTTPNFREFSRPIPIEANTRELALGPATIKVTPPKFNPFSGSIVDLTSYGNVIYSNSGVHAKVLKLEMTSALQDVAGLFFVVGSDSLLLPQQKTDFVENLSDDFDDFGSVRSTTSVVASTSEFTGDLYMFVAGEGTLNQLISRITNNILNTDWQVFFNQFQKLREEAVEAERVRSAVPNNIQTPSNLTSDFDTVEGSSSNSSDVYDEWDEPFHSGNSNTDSGTSQNWKSEFDD